MKLNFDVIADYLPSRYNVKIYGSRNRKLEYGRPLVYRQGSVLKAERLYLMPAWMLPGKLPAGCAVICVGGRVPQNWHSGHTPLMHIENSEDVMDVLGDIFDIYDRIERWDASLRDVLEAYEQIDLGKMLILAAEFLGNEISVSDSNLRMLYYCAYQPEEGAWIFADHSQAPIKMDLEVWESINSACRSENKITEPYLTNAPNLGYEAYCCNLYYGGRFMGCIAFMGRRKPFQSSDFALMDKILIYLKKALYRYVSMERRDVSPELAAFCAVLDGRSLDAFDRKIIQLPDTEHYLCFKLTEERANRGLPLDYMCGNLNAFMPGLLSAARYHDTLIGLIRYRPSDPEGAGTLLNSFAGMCHRMGYLAGISQDFQNLYDARHYYRQACYSVDSVFHEPGEKQQIFYFRDYILQYLLDSSLGDTPKNTVLPRGLLTLQELDREKGSEFIKTLDIYLQTECNASQTAERLFIHRSSFAKRIDRIQKVLDMDLNRADTRLLLRICLKLIR